MLEFVQCPNNQSPQNRSTGSTVVWYELVVEVMVFVMVAYTPFLSENVLAKYYSNSTFRDFDMSVRYMLSKSISHLFRALSELQHSKSVT